MQLSKILIFGGSFNPVHNGHISILETAIDEINPDKTIIVPTHNVNNKQTYSIDSLHRLAMLKLAFAKFHNLEISNIELEKTDNSYTVDTIDYFQKLYPDTQLYLLIGADQWNKIGEWHNYFSLSKKVIFVVANRLDNNLQNHDVKVIFLNNNCIPISSSAIRINPKPFDAPPSVLEYIANHGLYAIERISPRMSNHRFSHCLRVAIYAKELMEIHNPCLANLAYSAGIYHDVAKEMPLDEQEKIAKDILGIYKYAHPKVLHGYIGAYILRTNFCIYNTKILDAISRHTLPFDYYCDEPDLLTKILYLADKLEPARTNDDVFGRDIHYFRTLAIKNVDVCFSELYEFLQSNLNKK